MVAPILRKRRFAPRIVRAAPNLARSFERHLRAENKPDRTVDTYLEAVRLLEAFLAGRGVRLGRCRPAHIEAFLADLLARWKPATAAMRSAACRAKAEQLRAKYGL